MDTNSNSRKPLRGWAGRMAWRDSRGKRRILLLSALSIFFGVAALVAIGSLRDNLEWILEEQTRSLLGADLALEARQPFNDEMERFFRRLGGESSREIRFQSMAAFEGTDAVRLVQVRSLRGGFPFYGAFETDPADRRHLRPGQAIVEESLLMQLGLRVGGEIRLGRSSFEIAGALRRVAGESEVTGFFAPRVYIRWDEVEATELVQKGSIVRHRIYFRFDEGLTGAAAERFAEAEADLFVRNSIRSETVEQRRRNLERLLGNLFGFLGLIGLVALMLGGVGVSGAVQVYVREKLPTVALLRCLGGTAGLVFRVYLLQVAVVAAVGVSLGALAGVGVQHILPVFLAEFLPFDFEIRTSYRAVLGGLVFGWLVAMGSALLPLLEVRRISPLAALRADFDAQKRTRPDALTVAVVIALAGLLIIFSLLQTAVPWHGAAFAGVLLGTLGLLVLLGMALRRILRWGVGQRGSFTWRLALGNLYRPQNRTLFLIVTLGMGAFLINTLYLASGQLLGQVRVTETGDAANLVLLDVQPDQVVELSEALAEAGFPPRDILPIVTMRLDAINGRSLTDLRNDPEANMRRWVFTWEFRASYRAELLDNEVISGGEWIPLHEGGEPYPISVAENILRDMNAALGDRLVWDVQGVPIETYVASVRDVEWQAGRQNFGVIFAPGVLEAAPTIFAVTTRVSERAEAAAIQQLLIGTFPNVSMIDLTLVFETLDDLLQRAAFVVQFMAGFTIATGLLVLAGAILTSRYQRIRESALLRTLGARSRVVRQVMGIEYALLGLLGGLIGTLLALLVSWALTRFFFEMAYSPAWTGLLISLVGLVALTLVTGFLVSRRVATQSPLIVLREEG
ncbi:MAG: FtsX-like permease family protein [Opitutales bacterium]|nr:FtsX-like permease family protein [Opitutales bacterium]